MVYNININGTDRPMTIEETAAYEQTAQQMLADYKKMQDVQIAKAATRASGLAKLKALGLTDAEVAALIGG